MQTYLDFGICIDEQGDAFRGISHIEEYFPADHLYLMDFINSDNHEKLTSILSDIKATYENGADANAVVKQIRSLHPYFKLCNRAEACFNKTLAGFVINNNPQTSSDALQKTFEGAMYIKEDMESDINYWLSAEIESFEMVVDCYNDIRRRIALIFDDSKPRLASLPIAARCALYNTIADTSTSLLEIPVTYEYYPSLTSHISASIAFDDNAVELYQSISSITPDPESDDISDDIYKLLDSSFNECDDDSGICYMINSFTKLLQLETYLMLQDNSRIKRCSACGRLFVVQMDSQEFCTYPDETGSSCYSKNERHKFELAIYKYYRRAYKKMFQRISYGLESKESFEKWKADMSEKKERILNGTYAYSIEDGDPFTS